MASEIDAEPKRGRLRWLFWSLLFVCGCAAIWTAGTYWRYRQMMVHVAAVERLGGSVFIESPAPAWLSRLLPDDSEYVRSRPLAPNWLRAHLPVKSLLHLLEYAGTVTEVSLERQGWRDRQSNYSGEASFVYPPVVTADDLRHIAAFSGLKTLGLRDSAVGDAGMTHLRNLRQLRILNLTFARINDRSLEVVSTLTNLERLGLAGTAVSDDGLVHLLGMPRLSHINVCGTLVTVEGDRLLSRGGKIKVMSDRNNTVSQWSDY